MAFINKVLISLRLLEMRNY